MVLVAAACTSGTSTTPATSGTGGSTTITAPTLTVHGPVPIRLLSTDGPPQPTGPVLATSISALRTALESAGATHGGCAQGRNCFSQIADPPIPSLLIAVVARSICQNISEMSTSLTLRNTMVVDVQQKGHCTPGFDTALPPGESLYSVPRSSLPAQGSVTVIWRSSYSPGAPFREVGRATLAMDH